MGLTNGRLNGVIGRGGDPPSVSHDYLKEALGGVREGVKSLIADAEARALIRLGKSVGDRLDAETKSITETLRKDVSALVDRVEASLMGRVEKIEKGLATALEKAINQTAAAEKAHAETLQRIETLLKSLPAPVVHVAAPEVNFAPTVNVPEQQAPVINVAAPNVSVTPEFKSVVNVPELRQPDITFSPSVNVPEMSPHIKVDVPTRKLTKRITYDEHGRPATIEEEG